MASKREDREQRAGRTGTRDHRGLDSAARKRSGKSVPDGVGTRTGSGYAEQVPQRKKPPA